LLNERRSLFGNADSALCVYKNRGEQHKMHVRYASVLILAVLPVAAQEPVRAGDANLYSLEKERALGRQLANDIRQKTTAVNSPRVQEYVDHLGQKIASHIQGTRFDYTFNVIADDTSRTTHEPIALPGGVIFIPAALFHGANDEAEFAGMLAHAMEHVAQRHGTRHATANNMGSIPLVFLGGWVPRPDGQAVPLGFLGQLRSNELEADALAVKALALAGFDPTALVRYVERVRPASPGTLPKVFSPLPELDQRIAALRVAIARLPQTSYADPGMEFAAIRDEVVRLTARPEDTRPTLKRYPPTLKRDRPTLKRDK
jgi:predicted Zn-dependent protease